MIAKATIGKFIDSLDTRITRFPPGPPFALVFGLFRIPPPEDEAV